MTATTATVSGLASATRDTEIVWTFTDERTERVSAAAFDRRSDTPALAALSDDCCDCPDPTVCECQEPLCENVA